MNNFKRLLELMDSEFENALNDFIDFVYERMDTEVNAKHNNQYYKKPEYTKSDVWIKVISEGNGQKSVYCFVSAKDQGKFKAGDILKPASWAAPAKNFARGNIFDPKSYQRVTPYGV